LDALPEREVAWCNEVERDTRDQIELQVRADPGKTGLRISTQIFIANRYILLAREPH
jgi:hypothetical protein